MKEKHTLVEEALFLHKQLAVARRNGPEYRRLEEAQERFFRLALDMHCIAGTDGYLKRVNPVFERTLGMSSKELLSKTFFEFVHPEDRERTTAALQELTEGHRVTFFENRYRLEDGCYRWMQWQAALFPKGGLVYAVARDITSRKQAEDALQASEKGVRRIAKSLDVPLITEPDVSAPPPPPSS